MLNIKSLAALGAGALVVGLAVGGWTGYRVAAGGYEKRIANASTAALEAQNAAVVAANRAAEAERKRTVSAIEVRAARAAIAQGVIHETHADPGPIDCEWRPSQRLRIERIYAAYGFAGETAPRGVPDAVRLAPVEGSAARGVGRGGHSLGLRLLGTAPGLRGGK